MVASVIQDFSFTIIANIIDGLCLVESDIYMFSSSPS